MADLAYIVHITIWTSLNKLDGLAFRRTMDRLYSLILHQSRPPRPIVGPLGTLMFQLLFLSCLSGPVVIPQPV